MICMVISDEILFQNIVQGKKYKVVFYYSSTGPLDLTVSFRDGQGGGAILGSSHIIKWVLYPRDIYDYRNNNRLFFCMFRLYTTLFAILFLSCSSLFVLCKDLIINKILSLKNIDFADLIKRVQSGKKLRA